MGCVPLHPAHATRPRHRSQHRQETNSAQQVMIAAVNHLEAGKGRNILDPPSAHSHWYFTPMVLGLSFFNEFLEGLGLEWFGFCKFQNAYLYGLIGGSRWQTDHPNI